MLRRLVVLALIAAVVGFGVFWVVTIPATVPASALAPHTPNLDNGKTMFLIGGCASCHATPGQDDKTKLGGGFGLKSPFGTFYTPNISPDPNQGIGKWTEANFVTAMVKGTSPDGRHYFPAFPYTSYQRIGTGDLRDLFAYLKTLPAVQDKSKPHDVPFPFNIRRTLGGWKFLFLDGKPFEGDPTKDAAWNRGAYLVNGPGPLRRMPFAAQHSRRHHRKPALRRRACAGWRWLCAEHHAEGLEHVAGAGRQAAGDRRDAGRRHRRRRDGQGRRQHRKAQRGGSRGDRDLHQVAAAGRRAEATGIEIALVIAMPRESGASCFWATR